MANRVLLITILTAVAICPLSSSDERESRPRLQSRSKEEEQAILLRGSKGENLLSHEDSSERTLPLSQSDLDRSSSEIQFKENGNHANEILKRVKGRRLNHKYPRARDRHAKAGPYDQSKKHREVFLKNQENDFYEPINEADPGLHVQNKELRKVYLKRRENDQYEPINNAAYKKRDNNVKAPAPQSQDDSGKVMGRELLPRNMEVIYKPAEVENKVMFLGKISHPRSEHQEEDTKIGPTSLRNPNYEKSPKNTEDMSPNKPQNKENFITQHQNEYSGKLGPGDVPTFLKSIQQNQLALAQARMRKSSVPKSVSQESTVEMPSLEMVPPGPRESSATDDEILRRSSLEHPRRTEGNFNRKTVAEGPLVNADENYPRPKGKIDVQRDDHLDNDRDDDGKPHNSLNSGRFPSGYSFTPRQHGNEINENWHTRKVSELNDKEAHERRLKLADSNSFEVKNRQHGGHPSEKLINYEENNSRPRSFEDSKVTPKTQHHSESDESPVSNILSQAGRNARAPNQRKKTNLKNRRLVNHKNDLKFPSGKAPHDSRASEGRKRVSPTTNQQLESGTNDSYESHVPRKDEELTATNANAPKLKNELAVSSTAKNKHDLYDFILKPREIVQEKLDAHPEPKGKQKKERHDHPEKFSNPPMSNIKNKDPAKQNTIRHPKVQSAKQQAAPSKSNWSSKKEKQTPHQKLLKPSVQANHESYHPMKKQQKVHGPLKEQARTVLASKKPLGKSHNLHTSRRPAKQKLQKARPPLKRQRSQVHKSHAVAPDRHQATKESKHHHVSGGPMKSSPSGEGKKKGKSHGFKKSHKSGHKESKGHEGDEGHEIKKGHKKIHKKEYDNDHKEDHHQKGALEEDSAHHGQHRQGHYEKGDKGVVGHKKGSSKQQQKGHNEKGFKEMRHSKEYMVQKKHYKDVDDKEYHGNHDHFDKFFEKFKKGVFDAGSFLGDKHHTKHHKEGHHKEGDHHHHHKEHEKHHGDDGHHHHYFEQGHDEGHHEKHQSSDDGDHH